MAAAVHIPESEVSDIKSLLDLAADRAVIIERAGSSFRLVRQPGRTATEAFEILKNSPGANVEVDDDWAKDMGEIIARRHTEVARDPWE